MVLYQLSANVRPVQIVRAGDGATLIVNRDIVNSVLYGDRSITAQNYNTFSVIDALGSVTVDGTTDIWAIPLAGSPTVDVVQGAAAWAPSPALVAAQISTLGLAKDSTVGTVATNTTGVAKDSTVTSVVTNTTGVSKDSSLSTINSTLGTPAQRLDVQGLTIGGSPGGVPLLRDTSNLGNGTNTNIPANATTTLIAATSISQPGFEAVFSLSTAASSGTINFATITLQWKDSFTGLTVGQKSYVMPSGNGSANAITCYLSGPCRGNQIILTVLNNDPSVAFTLTWAFNQTSHVYLVDRYLQPLYPATPPFGQSQGGGNPSKGLLFSSNPSIGPSGTITRMSAASNLKCKVSIDNGAQANGCAVTLSGPSTLALYNEVAVGQSQFRLVAAAGTQASQEWQMPNGPVNVNMINQAGTNTISPSVTIIAMEY